MNKFETAIPRCFEDRAKGLLASVSLDIHWPQRPHVIKPSGLKDLKSLGSWTLRPRYGGAWMIRV